MPDRPPTGRRDYDAEGGLVVPLRDFLEQQIRATREGLTAEMSHVRAELESAKAQGTKEHTEVRQEIANLGAELGRELLALRELLPPDAARRLDDVENDVENLKKSDTARTASTGTALKIAAGSATATALVFAFAGIVLKLAGVA